MRVTIVGGGISGLACANRLTRDGASVTLLEASDQLGGLGTFFESQQLWIDRFYHCVMPSDDHLLPLISEVGLADEIYWKPTTMGFVSGGTHYPFNTALDLLRFKALTLPQRLKLGVTTLRLRRLGRGKDLDAITSKEWLTEIYGRDLWTAVWEPLYRSKFGEGVDQVPALYIWERLGRESNKARRGYLRCGHKGLIDALEASIISQGGEIRISTPVVAIDQVEDTAVVVTADGRRIESDWVISTVPLPLLTQLTAGGSLVDSFRDPGLQYQGVINALFFTSRPLDGHYWTPVVNSGTQFDGVIEMSALVDRAQYGDRHLVYVAKYVDRESELFAQSDDVIGRRWQEQLLDIYQHTGLSEGDIVERRVFRAPFVEPIYPAGYARVKPAIRCGETRLLLATTAQVYPNITSWNSSVGLAEQVISSLQSMEQDARTSVDGNW